MQTKATLIVALQMAQNLCFCLFEHFLIFWLYKILQLHPTLFFLEGWNQPILQGALVPSIGELYYKARSEG